jgi:hypothetical protein
MKQPRLFRFLCLLICVSLACDIPMEIEELLGISPSTGAVQVESVTVSPASGSGHFSATVKFSYDNGDGIRCYVDSGEHDGEIVHSHGLEGSAGSTSEPFTFDFTKPGQHTLTCTGYSGNSSASASFSVTSGPEPLAPSGDQPSNSQPLKINGSGTVSGTNSWGNSYSVQATSVLLTVKSDNSAELYVVYTMNVDYTREEYMYFNGTANPDDGTVTFTDCNLGGSPSGGTLAYTGQALSGLYTCILSPKGGVQQEWKLKMP